MTTSCIRILVALACSSGVLCADVRFQVVPYLDGKSVTDARVCFFKGRQADNFSDRFLVSNETRCYPASDTLRLPTGFWNYYVERPGAVSGHPHAIATGAESRVNVRPMRVELLPAGVVQLTRAKGALKASEYFAFYLSNEGQPLSRPCVHPVPTGADNLQLPAGMHLIPLIIRDGMIVWAGLPLVLRAGELRELAAPERPNNVLVAVVGIDPGVSPEDRMAAEGAKPPAVRLVGNNATYVPAFPLRLSPIFDGSVVLLEKIPAGTYKLELSGEQWQPDHVDVVVPAQHTEMPAVSRALMTRPVGRLDITWVISAGLARDFSLADCESTATPPTPRLTMRRCAFGFDHSTIRDCPVMKDVVLPVEANGVQSVSGLPVGDYYIDLAKSGITTRIKMPVRPAQTVRVAITLDAVPITGRVTRGSAPVRAALKFQSGAGLSDADTGEYNAYVTTAPGYGTISVTPCDTKKPFLEVPSTKIEANARYDIDIPANRLAIGVVDAASGAPLNDARVTNRLLTADNTVPPHQVGTTGADGLVTDEELSPNARFEVCAELRDYDANCVSNISITQSEQKVTVDLRKSTARLVRVISPSPLGAARVYVALGTNILAIANIEHGDSVRLDPATPPTAYLYLAAHDYPLTRLAIPNLSAPDPTITLPAATGTPLAITLSAQAKEHGGSFTIGMAGVPIPRRVLQFYQLLRGGDVLQIRNGDTVRVAPIDASLPLTVFLWPWPQDAPLKLLTDDPFETPAALRLMHQEPVTGSLVVLYPTP